MAADGPEARSLRRFALGAGIGSLVGWGGLGMDPGEAMTSAGLISAGLVYTEPSVNLVIYNAKQMIPRSYHPFFIALVSNLSAVMLVGLEAAAGAGPEHVASVTLGGAALLPFVTTVAIYSAIRIRHIREMETLVAKASASNRKMSSLPTAQRVAAYRETLTDVVWRVSRLARDREDRRKIFTDTLARFGPVAQEHYRVFVEGLRPIISGVAHSAEVRQGVLHTALLSAMGWSYFWGIRPLVEAEHPWAHAFVAAWVGAGLAALAPHFLSALKTEKTKLKSALESLTPEQVHGYGRMILSREYRSGDLPEDLSEDLRQKLKDRIDDLGEWKAVEEGRIDRADYTARAMAIIKLIREAQPLTAAIVKIFDDEGTLLTRSQKQGLTPNLRRMLDKSRSVLATNFREITGRLMGAAAGVASVFATTLAMHQGLAILALSIPGGDGFVGFFGLGLLLSMGEFFAIRAFYSAGQVQAATRVAADSARINILASAIAIGTMTALAAYPWLAEP